MRKKKKMRQMSVEWRMGEGRRLSAAMDVSGDSDGPGNKEMKYRKVRKKRKEVRSFYLCSLCL